MKLNNIKAVPALTLVSLLAGAGTAAAEGFAPWDKRGVVAESATQQVAVDVRPYYRDGLPNITDQLDAVQAEVDISAWYAPARGLPDARTAVIELAAE